MAIWDSSCLFYGCYSMRQNSSNRSKPPNSNKNDNEAMNSKLMLVSPALVQIAAHLREGLPLRSDGRTEALAISMSRSHPPSSRASPHPSQGLNCRPGDPP